jgi:ribose transport system permease protein
MTRERGVEDPTDVTLLAQAAEPQVALPEVEIEPAERPGRRWVSALSVTRLSAVYLWVFFIILFGLITPSTFLTGTTFRLVFSSGVVTCLMALGFLVPLAAGVYDLSIGGLMALSLALSVYLQIHSGLPPVVGALIGIAACLVCGFANGFIVVRLRVNSFIATLGTSQVLLAICLLISNNQQLTATFPNSWSNIGNNNILGIPIVLVILLVVAVILWYVLELTRVGRYLFATGGNPDAARLSGVKTNRAIWGSFVASSFICALAGIIYSMQTGLFSADTGPGYLFPAVAAVFLGASQLSQRPNVWGTLIAYFALAFGIQGLVLSASTAATWSQPLFEGVSLIIAVAIASRPALRKLREVRTTEGEAA